MKFELSDIKERIDEVNAGDVDIEDDYANQLHAVSQDIIGHITPYYTLFCILAQDFEPKYVVELGSWRAYAAAHFAAGNPNGKVLTIDIHKDDQVSHGITKQVADHYDNLTFVHAWTWNALPNVRRPGLPIDILFIDAWHEYQYVTREWNLYEPLLADEALVIVDDMVDDVYTVDMLRFWDELDYDKFVEDTMHMGVPMGFLKYVRNT